MAFFLSHPEKQKAREEETSFPLELVLFTNRLFDLNFKVVRV